MHVLDNYIKSIKDFPKEGIVFRDITTVTQNPEGLKMSIDELAKSIEELNPDVIVGIEARGFIFGAPVAYKLNKAFVPVRKPGKLPRATISQDYELEYGFATIEMHTDSIKKGQKVVIIDDLLATGGTVRAACSLVEQLGGEVLGFSFLVELKGLNGRENLKGYKVESIVAYDGK